MKSIYRWDSKTLSNGHVVRFRDVNFWDEQGDDHLNAEYEIHTGRLLDERTGECSVLRFNAATLSMSA
jgi:hypothetical protein